MRRPGVRNARDPPDQAVGAGSSRVRVRILLKDAAQEITLRTTGSDRRYAEATMDGDDGTRWSFRMPDRRDLPTDLLLDIEYEHSGHGLFGVRLAAHEHSSS